MEVGAVYYDGEGRFSLGPSRITPPGPGEVRLDVAYCGVCGTDIHIAKGHMDTRIATPQVIGHEMSGTVAELGDGVDSLVVGEEIVVRPLDTRDHLPSDRAPSHISPKLRFIGIDSPGAFQRCWTVPAATVHRIPVGTDLRLAALVEPLAVACHDVRLGEVAAGETVVVIGGGPIGILIALVARATGARVLLSEPNDYRRSLATGIGLETHDPGDEEIGVHVARKIGDAGADVVFEVSGSDAGAAVMTKLVGARGRVVVVAIYPSATPVHLFDLFWKELRVIGARVYEREDYERAIGFIATGSLPLEPLITGVEPLERLPDVLAGLTGETASMKVLIDCRA